MSNMNIARYRREFFEATRPYHRRTLEPHEAPASGQLLIHDRNRPGVVFAAYTLKGMFRVCYPELTRGMILRDKPLLK